MKPGETTDANHLDKVVFETETKEKFPLIQVETKMVHSHPLNAAVEGQTKGCEPLWQDYRVLVILYSATDQRGCCEYHQLVCLTYKLVRPLKSFSLIS